MTPDPSRLAPCVATIVGRRLPETCRLWFEAVLADVADGGATVFEEMSRRLGRLSVRLGAEERTWLGALAPGHTVDGWRLDEVGRLAWLLRAAGTLAPGTFEDLVETTWRRGDSLGARAVLKALPLLPRPARFLAVALQGARSSLRPVLEAIACDNPYAAAHFHEVHFNQLVVKAVAADIPLDRLRGLPERVNPELRRLAHAHVAVRRAAGRTVPAAVVRLAAGTGDAA
jgi:hypothetical protein